ncbi:MAG: CBS domain-containing protein, partial [Elusimicrobia bacterium]|nr:CBS domain-containing protein [Elusimicrobiota bacterium]
ALLVILLGEIVPKVVARKKTEPIALFLAAPVRVLTNVFGPALEGLLSRIEVLLSWLSRRVKAERTQWNAPLIRSLLDVSSLAPPLRSVLNNILDFGNLPVSKVAVPKQAIFAMDLALSKKEFIDRVLSSGYSRVPVYRGSLDNVVGVIYSKDLLTFWRRESLFVWEDLIRPALRVSMTTPLADILREFRKGRHHLAIVFDPNGRVNGLLTLQDTLEAIVGKMGEEPEL